MNVEGWTTEIVLVLGYEGERNRNTTPIDQELLSFSCLAIMHHENMASQSVSVLVNSFNHILVGVRT